MDRQDRLKKISRVIQSVLYMLAALPHFIAAEVELAIIPPFLPLRRAALYISGICEFIGGLGLLIPRFRRPAAWGLAALLVVIWPANIYHAMLDQRAGRWAQSRLYHIVRQPLQVVLILWVLWATSEKSSRS